MKTPRIVNCPACNGTLIATFDDETGKISLDKSTKTTAKELLTKACGVLEELDLGLEESYVPTPEVQIMIAKAWQLINLANYAL